MREPSEGPPKPADAPTLTKGAINREAENLHRIIRPTPPLFFGDSDKWKDNGSFSIVDDCLIYQPVIKENYFDQPYTTAEKKVPRAIELTKPAGNGELMGLKKVPSSILWEILEADTSSPEALHILYDSGDNFAFSTEPVKNPNNPKAHMGWDRIEVSNGAMRLMQEQAINYLNEEANLGNVPEELLATAEGVLRYSRSAPKKKGSGNSEEDPKVERKWWKLFSKSDIWTANGQIGQEGDYLYYQDDRLRKQNRQRRVIIASLDPKTSGQNIVLTKSAWDILKTVPSAYNFWVTETSEKPVVDKKGKWRVEAKSLETHGSQTLDRMQKLIRGYVGEQVALGTVEPSVLATIDGIFKYKHEILGKIRDTRFVEKREPTLIEKILEEAKPTQGLSQVEVTQGGIKKYLSSKKLPAGASIQNLNFEFDGDRTTMTGFIDVPIPFVGGKINFNLSLANNQSGDGVTVTSYSVDTKSSTLRSRLDQMEPYLKNINSFIIDDVNEQLRLHNKFLRVLGISISPNGNFVFKIQNSAQSIA